MISLRYLTPSSIFCTFYSFFNSQTEAQIKTLKEEKKALLQDIIECERQILLWEKKIQLEKEK